MCADPKVQIADEAFEFFHNSRQIRRIQQNKIDKKIIDLTRDGTPGSLLNSQVS